MELVNDICLSLNAVSVSISINSGSCVYCLKCSPYFSVGNLWNAPSRGSALVNNWRTVILKISSNLILYTFILWIQKGISYGLKGMIDYSTSNRIYSIDNMVMSMIYCKVAQIVRLHPKTKPDNKFTTFQMVLVYASALLILLTDISTQRLFWTVSDPTTQAHGLFMLQLARVYTYSKSQSQQWMATTVYPPHISYPYSS